MLCTGVEGGIHSQKRQKQERERESDGKTDVNKQVVGRPEGRVPAGLRPAETKKEGLMDVTVYLCCVNLLVCVSRTGSPINPPRDKAHTLNS